MEHCDLGIPIETVVEEEENVAELDSLTSALPDPVVHHIMSFLPTKDAARLQILSRRWETIWLTFPFLDLHEIWFNRGTERARRDKFLRLIEGNLRHHDLVRTQKLRFSATNIHDKELVSLIDKCLASVMEGKVQELDLRIPGKHYPTRGFCDHYLLPNNIFSNGSYKVNLVLDGCQLGEYEAFNLPFLRNLTMRCVHTTDENVMRLIAACPILETLSVDTCHGFSELMISNPNLKYLIVNRWPSDLQALLLDVPNLYSLIINGLKPRQKNGSLQRSDLSSDTLQFRNINAEHCLLSLKKLELMYVIVKHKTLKHMALSFPNVEILKLADCTVEKLPLVVFHQKMKIFETSYCSFTEPTELNVPNLQSFAYDSSHNVMLRIYGGVGSYKLLKNLAIHRYHELTDKSLRDMLHDCPILESLALRSCENLKNIKIVSSTLRDLVVDSCLLESVEILAVKLVRFKYVGSIIEFSQLQVSNNFQAEINLMMPADLNDVAKDFHASKLMNLLRNFDQAIALELESDFVENVYFPESKEAFPPLLILENLKVKTTMGLISSYVELLLGVHRISLRRETLSLDVGSMKIELKFHIIPEMKVLDCCLSLEHECIEEHLKEVRIESFGGHAGEIDLVMFLLSKAMLLKTMSISFTPEKLSPGSPPAAATIPNRSHTISKLVNHPKASQDVHIVFD